MPRQEAERDLTTHAVLSSVKRESIYTDTDKNTHPLTRTVRHRPLQHPIETHVSVFGSDAVSAVSVHMEQCTVLFRLSRFLPYTYKIPYRTKWKRKRLLRNRAKLNIAKQQWMQRSVLQGNNEKRAGKESYSVQKQTQCLPPSISLPCMTKASSCNTHVQQQPLKKWHHYFCYCFSVGDKVNLKNT